MSADATKPGGRLVTILFADLVGFSALKAWNEPGAAKRSAALREIVAAEVGGAGGSVAEANEEGAVAQFPATGAAYACAERILQRIATRNAGLEPAERFEVTIGLSTGEAVSEGGQLLGLPVQTAVVAHTLADPGGIALTEAVYRQLKSQTSLRGTLLGAKKFPNLPDPVRVFVVAPAKVAYVGWLLRKRKRSVLAGGIAVVAAAAAWFGLRGIAGAGPAEPAPTAAAARRETVIMPFTNRDFLSSYDGGGNTLAFGIDPAQDGTTRLKLVIAGQQGWWGMVVSKPFDFTGYDTIVIPVRSETGSGFRFMLKDNDEGWVTTVNPGTSGAAIAIPLAAFTLNPDPKAAGDGKLSLAAIKELQFMHLDPARSDTIWIGAIMVTGPAGSSTIAR